MPELKKLVEGTARSIDSGVQSPQTIERAEIASWVWQLFREKQTQRDQRHELFRDRTPKDYWDDCTKRFIQFKRRPAYKKPWQSNLASATPNEKLIGVLSRLATRGMEAKIRSRNDVSMIEQLREKISNSLLKGAAIKNEDDFQIILEMLQASEKGTVIGFEDWYFGKRQIRDITDIDSETGEMKFKIKTIKDWNDVRSSLVKLEDFYPGTLDTRPGMIQDMDDCFLRTIMNEDEFEAEFGKYKDADKVTTARNLNQHESTPFWVQSEDVANDQVEVVRYFNKKTDEYVILANQVWINFIGKSTVSPMPWNHKHLPFWSAVFEPLDAFFFYGRSFIDKLISFTDSSDALFDRILDQMTLSVSKPVLTDGQTSSALTRGFLQPNNVITTDWTNGKPNFQVLDIPEPPQSGITLYQILQQSVQQTGPTSIDQSTQGGRKTAKQVGNEQDIAAQIISLFLVLMEQGIKHKNALRFANILQFYTLPIHATDGDTEARFKKIILRNEELSTGKTGTLQIEITPQPNQQAVEQKGQNVLGNNEFIEATPDFIRNFQYEVEIVPQSSVKMTDEQRQTLELNYQKVMLEMYPDKFNRDAGFEELNLKFNKDPNKMKAKTPAAEADMGMGGSLKDMVGKGTPKAMAGMPQ